MPDRENEALDDELIQLSAYIFAYLESKDKIHIRIGKAATLDHAKNEFMHLKVKFLDKGGSRDFFLEYYFTE